MRNAQESVHLVAATVGFLSLFLIWLAVVWGLILRNGWAQSRIKHATVYGIHQTVALLGLCLAAVHAFAQLASPGGTVTLLDTPRAVHQRHRSDRHRRRRHRAWS